MWTVWTKRATGALLALLLGCGPIEYVNEVTRVASSEVSSAEAVANEDDAHFRYWYTLAVEYLKRARIEASYADFQAANRFGRKAAFAARKARATALRSAADPSKMVRTPPLDETVEPARAAEREAPVPAEPEAESERESESEAAAPAAPAIDDPDGDDENPLASPRRPQ